MRILVITNLFPNRAEPGRATYNRQQMSMLSELCPLKVVAPIPWFPLKSVFERNSAGPQVPKKEVIAGIETFHPRYFTIPKIGRSLYGLLFFLSILAPILRIYNTFKFDIIFATWAYPDSFAAVLISKLLNKPILTKIHGTDINEYTRYWLRRKMISFALNNSEGVISVSKALRDSIIEIGVKPEKIKIIYNGVDGEIFRPLGKIHTRKALGIDIDKKVILFVGNLKFAKGLTYLIRAFASIATDPSRNVILIIIGQGRLRRELESRVREYGIQNCVYILGSKMHREIPKWMSACDLLCLPSLNEGVPNVILEALACGVPVVASNVGGIPEILTSTDYGSLVKPQDCKALQKALLECLEKSWNREVIHGHSTRFSWRRNAEMIYQEMTDILRTEG
jgi:teichuronic acid biosynthesis glycosyltransferase TuaC